MNKSGTTNYYSLNHACAKSKFFLIFIAILQFFYITILTEFDPLSFFILLILTAFGYLFLSIISLDLSRVFILKFKSNVFKLLFFISFFTTLLFSRGEYIVSTITYGLAYTRLNQDLGSGGIYSFINVIFYPFALLSVFYDKSRWESRLFAIMIFVVCAIDIFFLGTRNSVFFAIFFILIYSNSYSVKFSFANCAILFFIFCAAIYLFEYTTRVRSGFEGVPSNYWLEKSLYSEATSMSRMNVELYEFMDANFWYALPLFYFISYVSHPVVEFSYFLKNYSEWLIPYIAHLKIYFLNFTFQDSSGQIELLEVLRIRSGFYQTMYASLIVDFGLWFFLLFPLYLILRFLPRFYVFQVYLLPVISLSAIENYFYTGLTPVRAVVFIIFGFFFLKKIRGHASE